MSEHQAPRPRRTGSHVIHSQGINYLEKFFIDKGHTTSRPTEDYGYDILVNMFDEEGYLESGDIRIQVKASDTPEYSTDGAYVSLAIERKHYELWSKEMMPVFLVIFDATARRAFWLYTQAHFESDAFRKPAAAGKTATIHIPTANEFNESTVDYARERKALVEAQFEGGVKHHG